MTCYHPLHAYKGKNKDASKISIVFKRTESWRGIEIDLPCGQCVGCRVERARQWAVRCTHEASLYDQNCFITLTYNDQNIPRNHSLVKTEFPSFIKRVRKKYGSGIRYFHCGEYGDQFKRPHYHALLFNHDFPDKKFFSERNGNKIYTSDSMSQLWGKGFGTIGQVTFESASYVARYVLKKVTGEKSEEHYEGRIPEFVTMSRGSKKLGTGGIGRGWFDRFKSDVYPLDRVVVRGRDTRPPRFYDTLYNRIDPSSMALIKIKREDENIKYVTDTMSDGSIIRVPDSSDIRLLVKEEVKKAEIQTLVRPLEG